MPHVKRDCWQQWSAYKVIWGCFLLLLLLLFFFFFSGFLHHRMNCTCDCRCSCLLSVSISVPVVQQQNLLRPANINCVQDKTESRLSSTPTANNTELAVQIRTKTHGRDMQLTCCRLHIFQNTWIQRTDTRNTSKCMHSKYDPTWRCFLNFLNASCRLFVGFSGMGSPKSTSKASDVFRRVGVWMSVFNSEAASSSSSAVVWISSSSLSALAAILDTHTAEPAWERSNNILSHSACQSRSQSYVSSPVQKN